MYSLPKPSPGGRWPSKARSDEGYHGIRFSSGLQLIQNRQITARIPHQSPPEGGDSFPSGEAFSPLCQIANFYILYCIPKSVFLARPRTGLTERGFVGRTLPDCAAVIPFLCPSLPLRLTRPEDTKQQIPFTASVACPSSIGVICIRLAVRRLRHSPQHAGSEESNPSDPSFLRLVRDDFRHPSHNAGEESYGLDPSFLPACIGMTLRPNNSKLSHMRQKRYRRPFFETTLTFRRHYVNHFRPSTSSQGRAYQF